MKNTQDLNGFSFNAVSDNEGRPDDNQFPRPFYTSGSAHPWMVLKQRGLRFNFITLFDGRNRMIIGNIIDKIVKIPLSRWKPFQNQFCFPCLVVRCASSLRLAAHPPRTSE
jgi:hypothetical protein